MDRALSTLERMESQLSVLSGRMDTLEGEQNAISNSLLRIEDRVAEVPAPLGTGKVIPAWEPGTNVDEGRRMFATRMSERFGIIGQLMGSEMFTEDMMANWARACRTG